MSGPWLENAPGATTPMEGYFGWRPDLLEGFKGFFGTLWDGSPLAPAWLEMLRLRIAQIHGNQTEMTQFYPDSGLGEDKRNALENWRSSNLFDETEKALLGYAEQMPFAHHAITDDDAAAVQRILGEPGFVAYTIAITLFDALCRIRMVMELPAAGGKAEQPSATSPLR